ncbi:MAG: hypothetical protein ACRCX2_32405 [Paraclostridium sp.]
MDELKQALGQLYEEFGHGPITVRLSEILDDIIVKEQKKELEKVKRERLECL